MKNKSLVAEGLCTLDVVTDRLEDTAQRGMGKAEHGQKKPQAGQKDKIIGQYPPGNLEPQKIARIKRYRQDPRHVQADSIFPSCKTAQLGGQDDGQFCEGQGNHGEEYGLDPQGKKTDDEGQDRGDKRGDNKTQGQICVRRRPVLADKKGHTIGSNAEKHAVAKGENPCVAEEDVKTGHQGCEYDDLHGEIDCLEGGKQERHQHEKGQETDLEKKAAAPVLPSLFLHMENLNRCCFRHTYYPPTFQLEIDPSAE